MFHVDKYVISFRWSFDGERGASLSESNIISLIYPTLIRELSFQTSTQRN